jgi:hypothetical protein
MSRWEWVLSSGDVVLRSEESKRYPGACGLKGQSNRYPGRNDEHIDNAGIEAAPVVAPRHLLAELLLTALCAACVWFVGSITHLNVGARSGGLNLPSIACR